MLFEYKAIAKDKREVIGDIEALSQDVALNSLQRGGFIVVSIKPVGEKSLFEYDLNIFSRVSLKDVAIISRQIATLLEAHVPALKTFRLLASEAEKPALRTKLTEISDDIQNGVSIPDALYKHPSVFSDFFVNMVRGGEESGKLPETFIALADYLERTNEIISKVRGALIYPAFVIFTFIVVMTLMFIFVIPSLAVTLTASGQEIPIYTKIVLGISEFLVNYGLFFLLFIIAALFIAWRYTRGTNFIARAQIWTPAIGNLYRMLYLSRIADNMHTMLSNGISMVRAVEITATVVDNPIYRGILENAAATIKGGAPLSAAFTGHPEIPNVMLQMIKVGEETGEIGNILQKLAVFYQREVTNAINTVVSLIEPVMIILLGLGVGGVLASVLIPIYQVAGNI
ncbi:MAG: Type II secretion system F domain protein [Parcubacteria group bacterium GW2011_GWA1_47_8]|nr:MAG: Type II secretion system F domain protein [Parcubacteria group bacterium GW2011_GWA1_47_8]KKW07747.1 MAG: Type II secretion system F domain protein [Parcubacteria group bacterium GW2011_GWA2_49_16]